MIPRLVWTRNLALVDCIFPVMTGCLPLYVQTVLNVTNFGVVSFLPVHNLGGEQIKWGIENFKYSTWLGGGDPRNFYPTSHLINTAGELNLLWYLKNPLDAFKLVALKLVGAFDFDYLMPYAYSRPSSRWLASFFSFTIFYCGLVGVAFHLFTQKLSLLGSRYMPLVIFVAWSGVSLLSAIELRFTLPLVTYFLIVGCTLVHHVATSTDKRAKHYLAVGWVLALPLCYLAARIVRSQSVIF